VEKKKTKEERNWISKVKEVKKVKKFKFNMSSCGPPFWKDFGSLPTSSLPFL